jgi:hypothetical protein
VDMWITLYLRNTSNVLHPPLEPHYACMDNPKPRKKPVDKSSPIGDKLGIKVLWMGITFGWGEKLSPLSDDCGKVIHNLGITYFTLSTGYPQLIHRNQAIVDKLSTEDVDNQCNAS